MGHIQYSGIRSDTSGVVKFPIVASEQVSRAILEGPDPFQKKF